MQDYIYIVLSQTTSVVAKSLKKVLKNEYTHMSLSFHKDLSKMYTFARVVRENPFMGGPTTEKLQDYFFGKKNTTLKMKVYRIPITSEQKQKAIQFIKTVFTDTEGYRYNFLQPLEVLFKKPVPIYKTYVCSAFVYQVLKEGEIFHSDELQYFVTPERLGEALRDHLFYSGPIYSYPYFDKRIAEFKRRKLVLLSIPFVTVGFYSVVLYRDILYRLKKRAEK